jgi:predicted porin
MAGGAYAAKPKVKVNGGIDFQIGGSTQDLEPFQDALGLGSAGPTRGYGFRTDAEVHFNASGKTDAGMKWRAQIQLEADAGTAATDGTNITESSVDETWIRFSGSWGQVRLGAEDGAEDLMHISGEGAVNKAGDGGFDGDWTDYVAFSEVNSRFADAPTLTNDSSDHTKITYFTPRVQGLQVGVSFTPDTGAAGQNTNTDNSDDFENTWGFGVQYKKKFGGVKVGVAGVLHIGDAENETQEDLTAWMVGAEIGYGGWRLGGAYQDNGDGGEDKTTVGDDDQRAWDVGLGYASGPVHLGVSYLHTEVDEGSDGDDEGDALFFGGTYMLGGGAKVYAEVFWFDTESAISTNTNNEGFGFILGTGVKF